MAATLPDAPGRVGIEQASLAVRPRRRWLESNAALVAAFVLLLLFPFLVALLDGQSFSGVLASQSGNSKFYQGLLIEVFILAIYAISYDLLLGVTGLLSFGHAMFFAVGAYTTGILLKSLNWDLLPTLGAVVIAGVVQALLFSIVLPRVQGVTFALVSLGIASVFQIVVMSHEASTWTGGDVGLQGVPVPAYLNPATERLRFYFVALFVLALVYLFYRRFVDSPTGRVCVAIRENENRALVLGYNTFYFKLAALIVSSVTAGLGGMLHALYQPIVSPTIATMTYTVSAILMILIGGVGTLSGAIVGAAVYRLLDFFLNRYFGESSSFLLGVVYVAIVLFLPFGIVGTWKQRRMDWRAAWSERMARWFGGGDKGDG